MPRDKCPLAGKTVEIKSGDLAGWHITIEDWWENISGKSWMASSFSATVIVYTARVRRNKLPLDDDVVYGKALSCGGLTLPGLGYLVHISELEGGERFAFTG